MAENQTLHIINTIIEEVSVGYFQNDKIIITSKSLNIAPEHSDIYKTDKIFTKMKEFGCFEKFIPGPKYGNWAFIKPNLEKLTEWKKDILQKTGIIEKENDFKKPKTTFNNGILFDENNNIEIHKYSSNDYAYELLNYLINKRKDNDWVCWDEIVEKTFGFDDELNSSVDYKKRVSDAIRFINKYAQEKIKQYIILKDGKNKYKIVD